MKKIPKFPKVIFLVVDLVSIKAGKPRYKIYKSGRLLPKKDLLWDLELTQILVL